MFDEELEKTMLYYLIFENEEYLLDETDFVNARNKKIITAINVLKAEKQDISMLNIKTKLRVNSKDFFDYIQSLGNYRFGTNADTVYKKIIEMSKRRKMQEILKSSCDELQQCEDIDIFNQKIIQDINNLDKIGENEKTFVQQVSDVITKIEKNTLEKTDYSLYTGLIDLDKIICGLHEQELTIIGARPRSRQNYSCVTNSRVHC